MACAAGLERTLVLRSDMVKVFCDGVELQQAEVSAGELAVPWLLELEYVDDPFSRRPGRMQVNYQGWRAYLTQNAVGSHEPMFLLVKAAGRSPTCLDVRVANFSATGQCSIRSIVLPPAPSR